MDTNDIKALTGLRIRGIRTIRRINHEILRDLNFADVISITLLELKAYIVYHKFNIDTAS